MPSRLNTDLSSLHQAVSGSSSKEVGRLVRRKDWSETISAAVSFQASVDLGEGNTPEGIINTQVSSLKGLPVQEQGCQQKRHHVIDHNNHDAQTTIVAAK